MAGNFFDTNVLLYIAGTDTEKAVRAEHKLREGGFISVQVLNEATHVARRKMHTSWQETRDFLALLRGLLTTQPITIETHDTALRIAERYRFSIYDALIAAAALHAGCDTLWSEDMQHNMRLEGRLRIANPFRPAA